MIGHLVSLIGDWSLGQYLSFAALNLFGYNVRAMILLPIVQDVLRMTVVVEPDNFLMGLGRKANHVCATSANLIKSQFSYWKHCVIVSTNLSNGKPK